MAFRNIRGYFDIVIGNPPYVEFKNLDKGTKNILEKTYVTLSGKYDLYIAFYERGLSLLPHIGNLCFVTPSRFLIRDYGSLLRNYIHTNCQVNTIVNFGDIQIFDCATTYTGIFNISKQNNEQYYFKYLKVNRKSDLFSPKYTSLISSNLNSEIWNFPSLSEAKIIDRIAADCLRLENVVDKIVQGIASGKDEVFFVSESTKEQYGIEPEILRPILKGKDISRYRVSWSRKYVIYMYNSNGDAYSENHMKTHYPNCYAYLLQNKIKLSGRGYFDNSSKKWFELWNQRKEGNFIKPKIITLDNASTNSFTLDTYGYFGTTTVYSFSSAMTIIDNRYLLALLNSMLLEYIHKRCSIPQANGFYRYQALFIKKLPIKIINPQNQLPFINLVDTILTRKMEQKDTSELERKIDLLVYDLYGISEEERRIIDPSYGDWR